MAETTRTNPNYFVGDPPLVYTRVLWIAFLSCFFVSQLLSGSAGAVATSIVAIVAVPQFFWSRPRKRLLERKLILFFPGVFVLLLIPFIITAEEMKDVVYIFNFISFALTLPILALASQNRGADWVIYISVAALIGVVCAFGISIYQVVFLGWARAEGIINNPNTLAHVTLVFGVVSLTAIYPFRSKWQILFLLGPLLSLAVLMMTESRGALLSVLPVVLFSLAFLGHKPGVRRWIFAATLASIVIVGTGLTVTRVFEDSIDRFRLGSETITELLETGKPNNWGTYIRIELYRGAVRAYWESPVFGHGWQDAVVEAAKDIEGRRASTNVKNSVIASRWPTMHNDFLAFAAGAGLFGILSYLLLLAAPLLAAGKRDRFFVHRLFIGASLVSMTVIHGLVNAPFGHGISIMTYAYLTAILIGSFQEDEEADIVPPIEAA